MNRGVETVSAACCRVVLLACALLVVPLAAATEPSADDSPAESLGEEAREEGQVRLYSTREERREAGLEHQVTPWLTVLGLLEFEAIEDRFQFESGATDDSGDPFDPLRHSESVANLQLGFLAQPRDWLEAELVLEYETNPSDAYVDEALIAVEAGDFTISAGRLYLPFGEYFSSFVTGPIVELGETREDALTLSLDLGERMEIEGALYRGVARERDGDDDGLDWALGLEGVVHQRLGLGLSYLSDLGDSDERLFEDDDNRFSRKTGAFSAYAIYIGDGFETTLEAIAAEGDIEGFDADRDRPLAWNWELALFIDPRAEVNFRLEGSRELEDAPETRWGVGATFQVHPRATLTLEYLQGRYRRGLAEEDDGPLSSVRTVGAKLVVAF